MARKGILVNPQGQAIKDAYEKDLVSPGWTLFSEAFIVRLKSDLGLPASADDKTVLTRMGVADKRA